MISFYKIIFETKKSKENIVINRLFFGLDHIKPIYSGYLTSIDFNVLLAYEMKIFRL